MADEPFTNEELEVLEKAYPSNVVGYGPVAFTVMRRLLATARAGLADSERLDWLAANGVGVSDGFPSLSRAHPQPASEMRAEIDAARGSATPAQQEDRTDG